MKRLPIPWTISRDTFEILNNLGFSLNGLNILKIPWNVVGWTLRDDFIQWSELAVSHEGLWASQLTDSVVYSPVIPAEKGVPVSSPSADSATEASPGQDTGSGLLGWVKGYNGLLSKVAEKAKSSVDTVITTLDPQMRDLGLICKWTYSLFLQ